MTLNYIIIGKHIKKARKKMKITQEKLAELIDKCPSYISYIETGRKKLSLETLIDIANTLQVSADELLSFNIEYKNEVKDEFSSILENCSTYEKKIISDTARALKQSLRDERTSRTY